MSEFTVLTGDQVAPEVINQFLATVYRPQKANFIAANSAWLYRGRENQWSVFTADGKMIAYCAIIPTTCQAQAQKRQALWWVDLIVDPAFRGRGVQTLIDECMRATSDLKLGFPNELAAKIHRKHKWGVREDGQILLLPLQPLQVRAVQRANGRSGILMRVMAAGLTPIAAIWRWRIGQHTPISARQVDTIQAEQLAEIFERFRQTDVITTWRDSDFIRWRYLEAPYAQELKFYVAGHANNLSHYLIAHQVTYQGIKALRILDLFGDFEDKKTLFDLFALVIQDAIEWGGVQITIMSYDFELNKWLRRLGFVFSSVSRFCWHSAKQSTMKAFVVPHYWTLGDSDNDAPE